MFIIYLHIKLHLRSSNTSLVTAIKPTAPMLLFYLYSVEGYLNKGCTSSSGLLPYIISGPQIKCRFRLVKISEVIKLKDRHTNQLQGRV